MRKEYRDIAKVDDIFNAIDDFFSDAQITSLYTLIDAQSDRRVYHNISENLDLIFYEVTGTIYDTNLHYVILLVTTQYDSSKEVWFLPDVVCSGMNTHFAGAALGARRVVYYFPAPTLIKFMNNVHNAKLVINFNSENSTFMLSLIWYCKSHNARYEFARTSNMCFGMMEKSLDFDGGFFFGGDFVYTYEWIYGEDRNGNTLARYIYVVHSSAFNNLRTHVDGTSWYNAPYESQRFLSLMSPDTVNRFDAILRASIDYAPMRNKNEELKPPSTSPTDATKPYFDKETPLVVRNQTWATTMDVGYYVPMVCSITSSTKALPRYAPLLSTTQYDRGKMTNSVNKMTLVMPLWFMVQRDPRELDDYSYAGKNNVINWVDMRYMDSDRIIDSSFPTQEEINKYNCFQMGSRRARFGMKAYSGLAFKMEEDEESIAPNLGLLDFDEMEKHVTGGDPILNIDFGGELGYGGDTGFDNMPEGSFILKKPYTDYSSITFKFGNDAGTVTDTVTWTSSQLTSALNGTDPFNLLPANSPVTWGGSPGRWDILPFEYGSTSTKFLCDYQNCGLIGIKGNP